MRTLGLNAEGDDVKAWQAFLREQGLFAGTIDGSFGARTLESTKAFQRARGLLDDGFVGAHTLGEAAQLGLAVAEPGAAGDEVPSISEPWEAPEAPGDGALFVVPDPRVITTHRVGVLPCPVNPAPPVGWAYWRGPVPHALAQLAVEVESDSARFPMGSFVQAVRGGVRVAARVEWHDLKGKTGERGCFRGTNLFQPKPPG